MGSCIAALAIVLMVLKISTWLILVRFHTSIALNVAYAVVTALMIWSYVAAMVTTPISRRPVDDLVDDVMERSGRGEEHDEAARYCERCDTTKPRYVHHCSACGRCVYRMDHHCPWIANCVGWNNKKYFVLFLIYTATSCLLFAAMEWPMIWQNAELYANDMQLLQLTWTLALVIGAILIGYFVFQVYLLYCGLTTLEFLAGKPGELARFSFCYNMMVYFGRNTWGWWLPVAPALDPTMHGERETQQLVI